MLGRSMKVICIGAHPDDCEMDGAKKAARDLPGDLNVLTLRTIPANGIADLHTPILYIVPAQLLSACQAAKKGLDPDAPRMLSKITWTM
jgi:glucosamine 6-phosphate synthetase-like amidotransferase/phosphosugar isomerase protein